MDIIELFVIFNLFIAIWVIPLGFSTRWINFNYYLFSNTDWGIDYTIYEFPSEGEVIIDKTEILQYTVLSVDLKTGYIFLNTNEKISYRHYKQCFKTLSEIRNKKLSKILK